MRILPGEGGGEVRGAGEGRVGGRWCLCGVGRICEVGVGMGVRREKRTVSAWGIPPNADSPWGGIPQAEAGGASYQGAVASASESPIE